MTEIRNKNAADALARLLGVVDSLLGPGGCPWDQKQTPESLCDYVIEEAFELVDAIRSGDTQEACEEAGDLLFLLLFVARLYSNRDEFTIADALSASAAKMIRRHPHVFQDTTFETQEEQLRAWEQIKREEKKQDDGPRGTFDSLPKGLPPMLKAYRIHSKAARSGFTWENDTDAESQLASEWQEFQNALATGTPEEQEQEFGDYLFTLIEIGRRKGIKANAALNNANIKFLSRFEQMEALARERGQEIPSLSLAELNTLWDEAKAAGK